MDKGAEKAVSEQNKSLLPAGIIAVEGSFQRGDTLDIFTEQGAHIGCGITNYGSQNIAAIKGAHSDQIAALVGHNYGDEVIHRNNMVMA